MIPIPNARVLATLVVAAFGLLAGTAQAQNVLLQRADARYAALSFAEAATLYEAAAAKGADDARVAPRLADCYWRMRDMRKAGPWFARAAALPSATADHVYRYSEVLRSNGQYAKADSALQRYQAMMSEDSRGQRQANSTSYAAQLQQSDLFGAKLTNVNVNTDAAEMSAAYLGDRVVFASSRRNSPARSQEHTWNNAPFLDLYSARATPGGALSEMAELDGPFNTRFHESNISATADGREVWFTRNNVEEHKRRTDGNGVTGLKMFAVTRDAKGAWSQERPFAHNSDNYSVGHPALTPDGGRLYFTSNMPGGLGGTDIWYSDREANGGWSKPVNAGPAVNTEGNEMFPYAAREGHFFFSSDGHKGLGGSDVMMAKVFGGTVGEPMNVGAPINSGMDDFSFVLAADSMSGYLTSNRAGGKGDDDLYSFVLDRPLRNAAPVLEGTVMDASTGAPLEGATVQLSDGESVVATTTSGKDGRYRFDPPTGKELHVTGTLTDHRPGHGHVASMPAADTVVTRDLSLAREGTVVLYYYVKHAFTGASLPKVKIERLNMAKLDRPEEAVASMTDASGVARETLPGIQIGDSIVYWIELHKEGFKPKKGWFRYKVTEYGEVDVHRYMDLCLFPLEHFEMRLICLDSLDHSGLPLAVGRDLRDIIDINPIYFDLGKHDIRPDAATELDKIVKVMTDYPNMVIELGSHTDCRASKAFNEALSDRRAKSSAAYIVSKGIASGRISGKGYGESKLITNCPCEGTKKSKCSEEEHQQNRRTEFIIVKM